MSAHLNGSLFAHGTDLGDTRYEDGASSMIPGSTQLVTIGRYHDTTLGSDFSEPFDADLLGASGIDLVRASKNQFLLRAEREGSACLRLSDPNGDPEDVTTIPLYSAHAGRPVAGIAWKMAVTNASWTTDNGLGMPSPGCVTVKPAAAGQRVEITADANGAAKVLALDVI